MESLLKRYERNPILEPIQNNWWENRAVFNCGVIYEEKEKKAHMLYRAIGWDEYYISRLGYAESRDKFNFERHEKPALEPSEWYDRWGLEDPRITKIDDTYYITYVALSKPVREGGGPPRTAIATTKDFRHFEKHGVITPEGVSDKDVVLFPEKFEGKYLVIHRPDDESWNSRTSSKRASIWIATSKDLKSLEDHAILMEPKEHWESEKIGAGSPPIKTEYGYLLIYHGVSRPNGGTVYSAGAALLDLKNPREVIARTKKPILVPEMDYEKVGDVNNVVFPTGAFIEEGTLYVYYGVGDKRISVATVLIEELFKFMEVI